MSAGRPRLPQDACPRDRLIPGDADPQARPHEARASAGPHIRIQIILPEPLRLARLSPLLPRLIQIKPRLEHLERLPVIQAAGDDRPEDRREHMTRDTQPVSPRPVLPRLIHQAFTNIEDHSTDHAATLRQHLSLALASRGVTREDQHDASTDSPMRCVAELSRI